MIICSKKTLSKSPQNGIFSPLLKKGLHSPTSVSQEIRAFIAILFPEASV